MAEIKQPSLQRPNYFTGQLLGKEDLDAEQQYQLDQIRRHRASLHTPGVEGLDVSKDGDRALIVAPGSAIDGAGREILVHESQRLQVTDANPGDTVYVTIAYDEEFDQASRSGEGENYSRRTEIARLRTGTAVPPTDGSVLVLARVEIDAAGRVGVIDSTVRAAAGARLAPRSVSSRELADGAVTREKLHGSIRAGWVRMPFKPSSFIEAEPTARNFVVGVTKTYCDARGATGTMGIPVPPGATRLKTFVIAGAINTKGIEVELYLCGWHDDGPEEGTKLPQLIPGGRSAFRQVSTLNWELDEESHALALFVRARGDAEISLVAAEFE